MICLHGFDKPEYCTQCPKAPHETRRVLDAAVRRLTRLSSAREAAIRERAAEARRLVAAAIDVAPLPWTHEDGQVTTLDDPDAPRGYRRHSTISDHGHEGVLALISRAPEILLAQADELVDVLAEIDALRAELVEARVARGS